MADVLNLFDDQPELYGPKVRDRSGEKAMKNKAALEAGRGEKFRMANARGDGDWHPLGAPPLDWWVIDG